MPKRAAPAPPKRTSADLYHFHRPQFSLDSAPHALTRDSRTCIKNLLAHQMRRPPPPYPRVMCAAVLVALFVGCMGNLYVLLSRRAATLRSFSGDTALPGGRVDPEDESVEDTARREAFEEIGLPQDKVRIPLLCVLEPFLAGNNTLVTRTSPHTPPTLPVPANTTRSVIVLILNNTLRPVLNAPEVASLFSHPLASFLSTAAPFVSADPDPDKDRAGAEPDAHAELVAAELPYHTYSDVPWPPRVPGAPPPPADAPARAYRMHRFLTGREAGGIKPVFGLTAIILIRTATIGYRRAPEFEVHTPHEPDIRTRVAWLVRHSRRVGEAMRAEGLELEDVARAWEGRSRRGGRVKEARLRAKL